MKKAILLFILGITSIFTLNSCMTPAYSQETVFEESGRYDNVDINIILNNGIPYYFEGRILYYLYNGWYYYPYYTNRSIYYYRYSRPFSTYRGYRFIPHRNHRPYYRKHEIPRYNDRRQTNRQERYSKQPVMRNPINRQGIDRGGGNRNGHFGGRR